MANRNFNQPALQVLLDQINEDNSRSFTTALLTFNAAAADSSGAKNTKVTATAANGSGYTGTRDIFYNRVDLSTVPGSRGVTFQVGDAVNLSDLLPEINTLYGLAMTTADFTDAAIPAFPGVAPHETQTINMVATDAAVLWSGTLTLTIDANDMSLATAIPNNTLSGLTYVQPA